MELKKNRKIAVLVSSILAMIIVVSATFAWVTSRETKINHFENQGYISDGSVIVSENFDPPTEWTPGMEVDKEAYVTNTGSGAVLARVSFEEMLKVLGDGGAVTKDPDSVPKTGYVRANVNLSGYDIGTTGTDWLYLTIDNQSGAVLPTGFKVIKAAGNDAVVAYYEYETGKYQSVNLGDNAVLKRSVPEGDIDTIILNDEPQYNFFTDGTPSYFSWNAVKNTSWPYTPTAGVYAPVSDFTINTSQLSKSIVLNYAGLAATIDAANAAKWYYSEDDGYFYYLGAIGSGQSSTMLIDSVKLLGSAGKEFTSVSYDLAITVEAIQATKEALGATGDSSAGWEIADGDLLNYLKSICAD